MGYGSHYGTNYGDPVAVAVVGHEPQLVQLLWNLGAVRSPEMTLAVEARAPEEDALPWSSSQPRNPQ